METASPASPSRSSAARRLSRRLSLTSRRPSSRSKELTSFAKKPSTGSCNEFKEFIVLPEASSSHGGVAATKAPYVDPAAAAMRAAARRGSGGRMSFGRKPSTGSSSIGGLLSRKPSTGNSSIGGLLSRKPSTGSSSIGGQTPYVDPAAAAMRAAARRGSGGRMSFGRKPSTGSSSIGGLLSRKPSTGNSSIGGLLSRKPSTGSSSPQNQDRSSAQQQQRRRSSNGMPVRRISVTEALAADAGGDGDDQDLANIVAKLNSMMAGQSAGSSPVDPSSAAETSSHAPSGEKSIARRNASDATAATEMTEFNDRDRPESRESMFASMTSIESSSDDSGNNSSLGQQRQQQEKEFESTLSRKVYMLQREAEERESSMVEMADMLEEQRKVQNRLEVQVKKSWKPKVRSLSQRVFHLQREAEERESSMADMRAVLGEQQAMHRRLQSQIVKLITNEEKSAKTLGFWQEKATSLSKRLYKAEFDLEKRERDVVELLDQRRIQDERIRALESELESSKRRSGVAPEGVPSSLAHPGRGGASRPFSRRASLDKSMAPSLSRASSAMNLEAQMHEEAKIEVLAVEERLAKNKAEQEQLDAELRSMRDLIRATEVAKASDARESRSGGGGGDRAAARSTYRLTCRKCQTHIEFVGRTMDHSMEEHYREVWKAVQRGSGKDGSRRGSVFTEGIAAKDDGGGTRKWSVHFAQHFAKHCKKKGCTTEGEVLGYCHENVRVEVLKRSGDSALFWQDESEPAMASEF